MIICYLSLSALSLSFSYLVQSPLHSHHFYTLHYTALLHTEYQVECVGSVCMNERVSEFKYRISFDCTGTTAANSNLKYMVLGKSGYSMYSIPNTQIQHTAHILTPPMNFLRPLNRQRMHNIKQNIYIISVVSFVYNSEHRQCSVE